MTSEGSCAFKMELVRVSSGQPPYRRWLVLAKLWRNWPFRGVTLYAVLAQLRPIGALYGGIVVMARCEVRPFAFKSLNGRGSDIPPLWLMLHLAAIHPSLGWRALAPCVTSPHPETDRLEAKQLRVCLLPKRVEVLRQKSKPRRRRAVGCPAAGMYIF